MVLGQLSDSGALSFTDADQTDLQHLERLQRRCRLVGRALSPAQLAAVSSGFSADSNSWDYSVANAALQFLAAGETITLSFTVTATDDLRHANDDDSEVVTLTITGTNDAPTLAAITSGSIAEVDQLIDDHFGSVGNFGRCRCGRCNADLWNCGRDRGRWRFIGNNPLRHADSEHFDGSLSVHAQRSRDRGFGRRRASIGKNFSITVTDANGATASQA